MGRTDGRAGRLLHRAFEASLALKGLFAASEAALGLALFVVPTGAIGGLVRRLTAHEIIEDPRDLVAGALLHGADALSISLQHFYAVYLLGHGVLKLAVVLLLARGYLWAYPAAIAVLLGFIVYQVHRYLIQPAPVLILLSLLDLVVIVLTLIEFRRLHAQS